MICSRIHSLSVLEPALEVFLIMCFFPRASVFYSTKRSVLERNELEGSGLNFGT